MVGGYVREAGKWPGRVRGLGFLRRFASATSTGQAAWASRPPVQCVQAVCIVSCVPSGGVVAHCTASQLWLGSGGTWRPQ